MDFVDLGTCDLLALGRRALEMGARRLTQIARGSAPDDQPLRALLEKMALESELRADEIEQYENRLPEDSRLAAKADHAVKLIEEYLSSLRKRFGEGPLTRDTALFFAESLEEETSRFCKVLAAHAREWPVNRLFIDLAEREQKDMHFLREVVFES